MREVVFFRGIFNQTAFSFCMPTSTLSQRKGRPPQPSLTFSCQAGGGALRAVGVCGGGGGVLHDNDDTDVTP